jgi:hypothetical protein
LAKAHALITATAQQQMVYYNLPQENTLEDVADERFRLFLMGLVGSFTMPPNSSRVEQSVYEDIARVLVGPEAYLVFVFDRLIAAVSINRSLFVF